jgi:beta-fructofuranosidase
VVHEVYQERDGSLAVRVPESVNKSFGNPVSFDGTLRAPGSYAWKLAAAMPEVSKIQTSISFEKGTRACGLLLHASDDGEASYYIRLEFLSNRLVFDRWPRPGDQPFMVELERPADLAQAGVVELAVLVDRTIGVVYLNNRVAMSVRMYNLKGGSWGVFVNQGTCHFRSASASLHLLS